MFRHYMGQEFPLDNNIDKNACTTTQMARCKELFDWLITFLMSAECETHNVCDKIAILTVTMPTSCKQIAILWLGQILQG